MILTTFPCRLRAHRESLGRNDEQVFSFTQQETSILLFTWNLNVSENRLRFAFLNPLKTLHGKPLEWTNELSARGCGFRYATCSERNMGHKRKPNSKYLKYLQSEHWRCLRYSKLFTDGNQCDVCGKSDPSNDVHHLRYHKLYDVSLSDLIVLCRRCHDLAHEVIESFGSEKAKRMDENELRVLTIFVVRCALKSNGVSVGDLFKNRGDGAILGRLKKKHPTFCGDTMHLVFPGIVRHEEITPDKLKKTKNVFKKRCHEIRRQRILRRLAKVKKKPTASSVPASSKESHPISWQELLARCPFRVR